jgi:hypothetical protein
MNCQFGVLCLGAKWRLGAIVPAWIWCLECSQCSRAWGFMPWGWVPPCCDNAHLDLEPSVLTVFTNLVDIMELLSMPSMELCAGSRRLPGLLFELGSHVLATMAGFTLCLYCAYHVHCEWRCYKKDGSAKGVTQSLSIPWRVLHFPVRCNVCLTNLATFLFLEVRIFTCDCDDKLKSPEDTSSTASNISRGCWLLWG